MQDSRAQVAHRELPGRPALLLDHDRDDVAVALGCGTNGPFQGTGRLPNPHDVLDQPKPVAG
jgi:hypothetical protein